MKLSLTISRIGLLLPFGIHNARAFRRPPPFLPRNTRIIANQMCSNSNNENASSSSPSPWRSIDPDTMAPGARYSLCISSVVPRPVGVLTTVDPTSGVVNCAPFSYTSLSTHDPPIVTHGICLSGGKKKDSLRNIEATGEWVFNVLEVGYLEQANDTSCPMVGYFFLQFICGTYIDSFWNVLFSSVF